MGVSGTGTDLPSHSDLRDLYYRAQYHRIHDVTAQFLNNPHTVYWHIKSNFELGKPEYCYKIIDRFEQEELQAKLEDDTSLGSIIRAKLLLLKAKYAKLTGDYDNARLLSSQAFSLFEDEDRTGGMIHALVDLATLDYHQADISAAQEKLDQAKSMVNPASDLEQNALLYNILGIIAAEIGEFEEELAYYEQSLQLYEELGHYGGMSYLLNNIGTHYWFTGDLAQSREYYETSLKIAKQTGNNLSIAAAHFNIGAILYDLNHLEESEKYYLECLSFYEKYSNSRYMVEPYHYLVELYVRKNDEVRARKMLEKIENLENSDENKAIQLRQRYCLALLTKSYSRHSEKMGCVDEFKNLITFNDFDYDILIRSIKHLIELLILEYQNGQDDVVFDDLEYYMLKLFETATSKNLKSEIIFTMILQSKLALINQDIDKAVDHLKMAENFVEKYKLDHYKNWVNTEFDQLQHNLETWSDLADRSSIKMKIQELHILDYLKDIVSYKDQFQNNEE